MEKVLQVKNIKKTFKNDIAVNDISFDLKSGTICGLIGPNGAGKTTIMKIIANLCQNDEGSIIYFNNEIKNNALKKMSFMLEEPIIDKNLTAEENLKYLCLVKNIKTDKIKEVLKIVNLDNTGNKRSAHFSLGMRQRLGIAMALLSDPEILVLDEPVNGLDPEGIVEIRNLIKKLSKEKNISILISSHLLSELSETCDEYIIINHGKLIEKINKEELDKKAKERLLIKTDDLDKTLDILKEYNPKKENDEIILDNYNLLEVSKLITSNNLIITKLYEEKESLEDYYLSLVGDNNV